MSSQINWDTPFSLSEDEYNALNNVADTLFTLTVAMSDNPNLNREKSALLGCLAMLGDKLDDTLSAVVSRDLAKKRS